MELEELENLYNEQAYTEVITQLDTWLQENPENSTGWQLLGLSLLEEAKNTSNTDLAIAVYLSAYEAFSKVLDLDPDHLQARLNRAWIGAHEIIEKDTETLSDCSIIIASDNKEAASLALLYRFHLSLMKDEKEAALDDLIAYLEIINNLYTDNLPQLNSARYECFIRVGDLYLQNNNKTLALEYYKQAFENNPFTKRIISIMKVAFLLKDYKFTEQLLPYLFYNTENSESEIAVLLNEIKQLIEAGTADISLCLAYCKASIEYRSYFFGDDYEDSTLQQISTGKKLLTQYQENAAFFSYYIGTALFNIGSYEEACNWFNKALHGNPTPACIIRWYYATYKTTGEFPESWPNNDEASAFEWYLAGMDFSEISNKEFHPGMLKMRRFLYKKSFDCYYNYWNKNIGKADASNLLHYAMCCNNYGITLNESKVYVEAVLVHTIGYNISPFWEQLESRADAYHNIGKLEAAITDRKKILEEYKEVLPLMYYVSIHERLIEDLCALEEHNTALLLYEKILADYNSQIIPQLDTLPAYERDKIVLNIDRIKTGRAFIRTNRSNDLNERIQALETHLTEKPDDSDAYFNLMYLYFDNHQYEHCIGAINNRISIGGIAQLPVISQMKIFYFRGKASLRLSRYQSCITDMQHTLEIMQQGDISDNAPNYKISIFSYLAEANLGIKDYNGCLSYCIQSLNIYAANNWTWDQEVSTIRYLMALAFEGKGDAATCRKMIDLIITYDPGFKPAIEKRKQWGISEKLISGFRHLFAKLKALKQ
ncbi:hypothetical protein DVR12_25655 [Chitinophaga silvatica]|uniref:Tetratricopeptide repeat protein n=1 Tax=Chitinophaga silvatica TaxID=2282649 RepID=A0A3E1Y2U8_9BACT|nr:hypothetical protein [Chitinophaga silvatica]RFS18991.1 hypothetical protein DVR12_25655 [Chitinophaga silvatica]